MSYFDNFQYINYTFPDNIQRFYKNLSTRLDVLDKVKSDLSNFQPYYVQENETPEIVSFNVYNTVKYHWCIMLVNEINNIYTDWPKDTRQLDAHLLEKYRNQISKSDSDVVLSDVKVNELINFTGSPSNSYQDSDSQYGVIYRPHHFEDVNKNIYSYDTAIGNSIDAFGRVYNRPALTPISIYTHEYELNESKRSILIPRSKLVQQMEKELRILTNE